MCVCPATANMSLDNHLVVSRVVVTAIVSSSLHCPSRADVRAPALPDWDLGANAGGAAGRADDRQSAAHHLDPVGEAAQAAGIGQ
jgi:hypothetical protein